jgi:hypothetical protein
MTSTIPRRARSAARRVVVLGLALVISLIANLAIAQTPTPPIIGLEITPSRLEVDLQQQRFSVKILLVNHETAPRRIFMSVAGLGHTLEGAPTFHPEDAVADHLTVSADEFVLQVGQRKEMTVNGEVPPGAHGVYAAIVARFEPLEEQTGTIDVETRVASLFLLRGPRPWRQTVEVVDVGVTPGADGKPLLVYAAAKDTGNVHIKPRGKIDIFKDGELIDTVQLEGQTILPGFARRIAGEWDPNGKLTGRYTLRAQLTDPNATGSGVIDFTPKGEVEEPGASIENLRAEGGTVTFELVNTGTIPIAPVTEVVASQDRQPIASDVRNQDMLEPGDSVEVSWAPEVADGVYLITARAKLAEAVLDEELVALEVGGPGLLLWIALAALILVMLLFLWMRRRKREPEKS